MDWPHLAGLAGLWIGFALGVIGLVAPRRAQAIVRLKPDEARKGGFAEFRASYGGLYVGGHGLALAVALATPTQAQSSLAPLIALPLAAAWAGTALGRLLAIFADGQGNMFNWGSAMFELGVAVLIAAPAASLFLWI